MKKKIWLVLGGGWARWLAHIWAYQAIIEAGYEIAAISWASMGSMIWMLIAMWKTPLQIIELYANINIPLIPKNIWTSGFISDKYSKSFWDELGKVSFNNLQIPFYVSCTNLNIGKNVIFSEWDLQKIINASIALPLISNPVVINWQAYIDGGITDNLPAEILKQNFDFPMIGIDVNYYYPTNKLEFDKKTVLMRSIAMMFANNTLPQSKFCDIYICPERLAYYDMFNFDKIHELADIWYEETKKALANFNKNH